MKKRTKISWQMIVFVAIASVILCSEIAAQTNIKYGPLYNCPDSSMYNFKVVECPNEKECTVFYKNNSPEGGFNADVYKSRILDAFKAGGCTVDGKPLEQAAKTTPKANDEPNNQPVNPKAGNTQTGRFKAGDRVQASPMAMSADEYFENCTVIKDYLPIEGYDTYRVVCDDPKGGKGQESNVKVPFIRRSTSVGPAPKTPDCPFNEPPGTVSRASKPSAALFKRVIYEWKVATSNGRKVGVTFQSFQMGRSYRNVVLTIPGLGAQLKHTGAPLGATIYELKTTYLFCDRYTDSTIRWLVESQFACFKNRDGDWVCPVDSVPKYLEQIYLPNK